MNIFVNALALKKGGALTILKQFLLSIPDDDFIYYIFVSVDSVFESSDKKNVNLVAVKCNSFSHRFYWDYFGFNIWSKTHNIFPNATLSLQNTNFRTSNLIPNFVYVHNAIPFSQFKWNPFIKKQRVLWWYKNIYPLFINLLINSNTYIFVQTKSMAYDFARKFSFNLNKIFVISPVDSLVVPSISFPNIDLEQLNLFYPASNLYHKNHKILFESISLLDEQIQKKNHFAHYM